MQLLPNLFGNRRLVLDCQGGLRHGASLRNSSSGKEVGSRPWEAIGLRERDVGQAHRWLRILPEPQLRVAAGAREVGGELADQAGGDLFAAGGLLRSSPAAR